MNPTTVNLMNKANWLEPTSKSMPRVFAVVDASWKLTMLGADLNEIPQNPVMQLDIATNLIRLAQHIRFEHGPEWKHGVVFDCLKAGDVVVLVRLPIPFYSFYRDGFDDVPQYRRRHELHVALQADQFQRVTQVLRRSADGPDALLGAQRQFFTTELRQVNAHAPWQLDHGQDTFYEDDDL